VFDQGIALAAWRRRIMADGPWSGEQVDELEAHLLDAMADLRRHGLSAEEQFLVATHRLGHPATLATEYDKVTPWTSWRKPVFWAAVGVAWCLGVEAILDSAMPLGAIALTRLGLAAAWLGPWAFVVYLGGPLIAFASVTSWFRRYPAGHPDSKRALLVTAAIALLLRLSTFAVGRELHAAAWRGFDADGWRALQHLWQLAALVGLSLTACVAAFVLLRFRERRELTE
jgi:hypothetical protein